MEIRKIAGIEPDDRAAVDEAFAGIEPRPVACCNWPAEFPYAPEVSFRMFHTGDWLMLRFDVAERYTAALVTEDNGEVWTDSCAEFFIAPDEGMYYNFETTCIGRMLLGARKSRTEAEHASPEVLAGVKRYTTLPGEPFAEREG
ncbi:carbohydrate-binding family 9-like protein, partial [Alistipes sp.]